MRVQMCTNMCKCFFPTMIFHANYEMIIMKIVSTMSDIPPEIQFFLRHEKKICVNPKMPSQNFAKKTVNKNKQKYFLMIEFEMRRS